MCGLAFAPAAALSLGNDFTEPRKLSKTLSSLHPSVTYLEWLRAVYVGENVQIDDRTIAFIESC
jgi:hypothetical protein